jgi:hypothetical protein
VPFHHFGALYVVNSSIPLKQGIEKMSLTRLTMVELLRQINALKDMLDDARYQSEWTEIQHDIARVRAELNRRKHGEE